VGLQVEIEPSPDAPANSVMLYRGSELLGSTSVTECCEQAVIHRLVAAAQHKPAYQYQGAPHLYPKAASSRPQTPQTAPSLSEADSTVGETNIFSQFFGMFSGCCASRGPASAGALATEPPGKSKHAPLSAATAKAKPAAKV
jgi:hypothetical protein